MAQQRLHSWSRTLSVCAVVLGFLAAAPPAAASEACDKCDLAALWDEYISASKSSAAKAEEAAKLLGEAGDAYEEALNTAKELGAGLIMPPDPLDPLSWCGQVGDVVGKFQDAMDVVGAFGNLWQGSENEAKAKELMESANWYWKEAKRAHDCWKKCCEAAKQAQPNLVTENPDTDFLNPGLDDTHLRECLQKLSAGDLKTLRADADAGRLTKWVRAEYVETIKRIVSKDGTIAGR